MRWSRGEDLPLAVSVNLSSIEHLSDQFEHRLFLGMDHQGPAFAVDLTAQPTEVAAALPEKSEFIDLRECGWLLDAQQAGIMAYARGLAFWNRNQQYCGTCGSPAMFEQGGHMRRCCNPDCARMHFPRTDPAVIMLVEDLSDPDNPKCLLARNARFPERMMSTLAGFVDPLESLEETVAREVYEECGVQVHKVQYQASQPWPFPASIMLGFKAEALTQEIRVDGVEIEEAYWFSPEDLRRFGEWGDGGDYFCLPRKDSIARFLVESWMAENA